jgi:hypothetical protein
MTRGHLLCSLAVAITLPLVGCVDGQTPDCSDAAYGCGPDIEGGVVGPGEGGRPEGAAPTDGGDGGSPADAPADTTSPVDAPADTSQATDAPDDGSGDTGAE